MALIGPYIAACLLLVAAGAAKARRPDDTAQAMAPVLGRSPRTLRRVVRAGALVEALVGAVALVVLVPASAAAVAASYTAFALFVAVARRRGGALASCGCFGTPNTPATRLHVVVDLGLAFAAVSVAVAAARAPRTALGSGGRPVSVLGVLDAQPAHGAPIAFAALVCAWLVFHVLSTLPKLVEARRLVAASRPAAAARIDEVLGS